MSALSSNPALQISYERRLSRVTNYLHTHLDEDLDLNKLADIACMSPYHWHRIYRAIHGESVVATVKRLRLQRAATLLARSDMTIDKIAEFSGYPNLQSFTRIFASVYGQPPARYRKEGSHQQIPLPDELSADLHFPVSITSIDPVQLLSIDNTGSYMSISKTFDILVGCAASRQLFREDTRWIGIYYDDAMTVDEDKLRSKACISAPQPLPEQALQAPLSLTELRGGKYAVLTYKGPYSDMQPVYRWFFGVWLPASGQEIDDAPPFEEYLNNPRDTAPADLLSNIYMPLR
ncbi:AraC family transcriptional regulator [Undibacterium sp. Di27W]|uniref:AraC family transcriptional regulator n=1 Tax=Undibacterium sp. Di27W TaxID=3413036 RepID=UPI003BF1395A